MDSTYELREQNTHIALVVIVLLPSIVWERLTASFTAHFLNMRALVNTVYSTY